MHRIDARPGGCFFERLNDGVVAHMSVVFVQRDAALRMLGGLGRLQRLQRYVETGNPEPVEPR